ncbi:RimK family alpha-L-glutamate ligase [Streptomyces sp. NPDC021224]|uniref:ATP-grasp domain-containing protein n=1 Tax=unclassified Streptomyces TaxID=2593676 RepID=UPI0037A966A6
MDSPIALYWIRSERAAGAPDPHGDRILRRCAAAAGRHGMDLRSATVDDIVVACDGGEPSVRVHGTPVSPHEVFFHTKLMSWPANAVDVWRHLTTYAVLEEAGFCVTVPALHSMVNNDKLLAGLQDFGPGVRPLPTLRLPTRAYYPGQYDLQALGIGYPAVVKPSDWGGGNAVFVADGPRRLHEVLVLASASERTMVVQPWLGPDTRDHRVYCFDGEPARSSVRRLAAGAAAGNVTQGGSAALAEPPAALLGPARAVARAIGLPYVCVDFLEAGGDFWFSEIEVDGGTSVGGAELTAARFGAYRRHFDRFRSPSAPPRRWTWQPGPVPTGPPPLPVPPR